MSCPTTRIKDVQISRLVVGGNPVSGFSHASPARTKAMLDYFTVANIKKLLRSCEDHGVNTCFFRADNHVMRTLHEYWNEGGRIQWFAQTVPGEEPVMNIERAKRFGAKGVYLHGGTIDGHFESDTTDEIPKLLEHIRSLGLPAGCASHVPAHLLEIQKRGWAPDFYMVCFYNVTGYRGKLGVEQDEKFEEADRGPAMAAMKELSQPCIGYKILAAGRRDARKSFKEVFSKIKPIDAVNVGMFPPDSPSGDIVADNVALVNEFAGG